MLLEIFHLTLQMKVGALVAGDLALGLLMLTPNTNFMIHFAFHVLQQHHHLGLEKFFPELDRVVGSYLTQGERQITNSFHPTITFMAEISETEITFLDTNVYKGERFYKKSILGMSTHYKPKETFQFTNFYSCHPPGLTKGFIRRGRGGGGFKAL